MLNVADCGLQVVLARLATQTDGSIVGLPASLFASLRRCAPSYKYRATFGRRYSQCSEKAADAPAGPRDERLLSLS